jgi:hypothetical protein
MTRYGLSLVGLSAALAGQAPTGPVLPALTAAEQTQALGEIRQHALNYMQGLPDYTCTQVTRWTTNTPGEFPRSGVTESQVSYASAGNWNG